MTTPRHCGNLLGPCYASPPPPIGVVTQDTRIPDYGRRRSDGGRGGGLEGEEVGDLEVGVGVGEGLAPLGG